MPFDNALFTIPLLTGVIFLMVGLIMMKFPPKKINGLYGYRTRSSMKDKERWDFAQSYSAKEFIKLGLLLALSGLLGLLFHPNESIATFIGLSLMATAVIILIVRVEKAIKKRFGQE